FTKAWDMPVELEGRYQLAGHPGALRLLAWLNEAHMATYRAATAILLRNGPNASIAPARAFRYKYGFGLNWEQELAPGVGSFSRLGWNDGRTEAWAYTDTNYSGSLGVSIAGRSWSRPADTLGLVGVVTGRPARTGASSPPAAPASSPGTGPSPTAGRRTSRPTTTSRSGPACTSPSTISSWSIRRSTAHAVRSRSSAPDCTGSLRCGASSG